MTPSSASSHPLLPPASFITRLGPTPPPSAPLVFYGYERQRRASARVSGRAHRRGRGWQKDLRKKEKRMNPVEKFAEEEHSELCILFCNQCTSIPIDMLMLAAADLSHELMRVQDNFQLKSEA